MADSPEGSSSVTPGQAGLAKFTQGHFLGQQLRRAGLDLLTLSGGAAS